MLVRFPAAAQHATEPGAQTWLNLIWLANGIDETMFGKPTSQGPWWAGGQVEEYEHARVIHDGDSVRVVPKTDHGEDILRQAATQLGVHVGS